MWGMSFDKDLRTAKMHLQALDFAREIQWGQWVGRAASLALEALEAKEAWVFGAYNAHELSYWNVTLSSLPDSWAFYAVTDGLEIGTGTHDAAAAEHNLVWVARRAAHAIATQRTNDFHPVRRRVEMAKEYNRIIRKWGMAGVGIMDEAPTAKERHMALGYGYTFPS